MRDHELLERYLAGSDEAFAELVRRHIDWVHSAARRRLGDTHAAEDVAQAVFLILSRKAARLRGRASLAPWLFTVTAYACRRALRSQRRRRRGETEAAIMQRRSTTHGSAEWVELAPVLDQLVGRLRRADREAILLRFYQRMSLAEVGAATGLSEAAAQKRVERAVQKLRAMAAGKGLGLSAAALATALWTQTVSAAPAGLAATTTTAALGGVGAAGATAGVSIAKGAMNMMMWAKMKLIAAILAAAALTSGAASMAIPALSSDAELPTAQELLAKYEAATKGIPPYSAKFESTMRYETKPPNAPIPGLRFEGMIHRSGDQLDVVSTRVARLDQQGRDVPFDANDPWAHNRARGVINGPALHFMQRQGQPPEQVSYALVNNSEKLRARIMAQTWGGEPIHGGLGDDEVTCFSLFRSAGVTLAVRPATEAINGHPCYVLQAEVPGYGRYSVWIDPAVGHLARKASVVKSGNDRASGTPLLSHRPYSDSVAGGQAKLVGFTHEMRVEAFEPTGSGFAPSHVLVTMRQKFQSGSELACHFDHRRTQVNWSPTFDEPGVFQLDLPEGTPVRIQDASGRYVWRGGDVETDASAPARADAPTPLAAAPRRPAAPLWAWLVIAGVLLLPLAWWLRRRGYGA